MSLKLKTIQNASFSATWATFQMLSGHHNGQYIEQFHHCGKCWWTVLLQRAPLTRTAMWKAPPEAVWSSNPDPVTQITQARELSIILFVLSFLVNIFKGIGFFHPFNLTNMYLPSFYQFLQTWFIVDIFQRVMGSSDDLVPPLGALWPWTISSANTPCPTLLDPARL